jgi:two-component system, OmpR family, KDP operon response regulator KdpE
LAGGPRVLVIDDDPAIRRLLRQVLTTAGYRAEDLPPGENAVLRAAAQPFDLLILDIDESTALGPDPIRMLRDLSSAPILALSVRDDEAAAATALEKGADDYVRKPFGLNELLARANSALRRRARERGDPTILTTGDLEIDVTHRRVYRRGQVVHLSVKLYEVLQVLAEGGGGVLTHAEILRRVWGPNRVHRIDYLRVAIQALRRKLEADPAHPRYISTEPRVGYRLETPTRADIAPSPAKEDGIVAEHSSEARGDAETAPSGARR